VSGHPFVCKRRKIESGVLGRPLFGLFELCNDINILLTSRNDLLILAKQTH